MLMMSHGAASVLHPHSCHVHIPTINRMPLGYISQEPLFIRTTVDHLDLRKLDPLFVAGRRRDSRDHHELHELLAFPGQLPALCLLQTIFRRRHMLIREGFQELQPLRVSPYRTHSKMEKETYDLQLILPKLLLTRLVEEWKVAHMVNENIPQNGQFRIHGRNLAKFRLKWCSKAMQSGGRI